VSPVRYELGSYIPEDGIIRSYRRENLTLTILTLSVRLQLLELSKANGQLTTRGLRNNAMLTTYLALYQYLQYIAPSLSASGGPRPWAQSSGPPWGSLCAPRYCEWLGLTVYCVEAFQQCSMSLLFNGARPGPMVVCYTSRVGKLLCEALSPM
jgi:hypothetical protein